MKVSISKKDLSVILRLVDVTSRMGTDDYASLVMVRTLNEDCIECVNMSMPFKFSMILPNTTHDVLPPCLVSKDVLSKVVSSSGDEVVLINKENKWYFESIGVEIYMQTSNLSIDIFDSLPPVDLGSDPNHLDYNKFTAVSKAFSIISGTNAADKVLFCLNGKANIKSMDYECSYDSPFAFDLAVNNQLFQILSILTDSFKGCDISYGVDGNRINLTASLSGDCSIEISAPTNVNTEWITRFVGDLEGVSHEPTNKLDIDVEAFANLLKKMESLSYFDDKFWLTVNEDFVEVEISDIDATDTWSYKIALLGKCKAYAKPFRFSMKRIISLISVMEPESTLYIDNFGIKVVTNGNIQCMRRNG